MAGKRGQFTVFVILGFVLVSTFAFLLFARNLVQSDELKARANSVVEDALANSNINYYVKSCLDRVTDDAVYLAALQGGRIYENQGGSYPNTNPERKGFDYLPFNVSEPYNNSHYGILNISYGIIPNVNSNCLSTNPPLYPLASTFLQDIKEKFHLNSIVRNPDYCSFDTGAFGVFSLPRLCDEEGPNKINVTGEIEFQFKTCKGLSYGENSIQEQLAAYISNKTAECVDFKIFENIGYNITAINKPNTTVIFGKEELTVQTTYPFKVRIGRRSVTAYASFEVDKPIFLKELYEYIYGLLEKEYKDLYFEIDRDYSTSGGWDQKISVLKRTNPCLACVDGSFDDIYQVVDNRSNIRGKPLVFNFAIKNRIPALDYIHGGYRYNVVVMEGDEIVFEPFALDADENALLYTYGGWREDYVDVFKEADCLENLNDCFDNPSKYVEKTPDPAPYAWTGSELYLDTDQFASYKTTHQDIGFHITYINVTDEEGLVDYQNISIMVFDEPRVEASGDNIYDDIDPEFASIEDTYTLDAQSVSFFTMVEEFLWHDPVEPFTFSTVKKQVVIPDIFGESSDIKSIIDSTFTELGTHLIELKAKFTTPAEETEWTTPATWTVQVEECLPHRNPGTALYPYNNILVDFFENDYVGYTYTSIEDPFMAEHICCTDDFQYTSGTECFDYVDYGDFVAMGERKDIFKDVDPYSNYISGEYLFDEEANKADNYDQLKNEYRNNVIKRTFTRYCSNDRGNICSGNIVEIYEIAEDCGGGYDNYQEELCRGPAFVDDEGEPLPNNAEGLLNKTEGELVCVNYGPNELFSNYYQINKEPPPSYHVVESDPSTWTYLANTYEEAKELVGYNTRGIILPALEKEQESFETIYGLDKREAIASGSADGNCSSNPKFYYIPPPDRHPLDKSKIMNHEEITPESGGYKCEESFCHPYKGTCALPNLNTCTCAPATGCSQFDFQHMNSAEEKSNCLNNKNWCGPDCRQFGPNQIRQACACAAETSDYTKTTIIALDNFMNSEHATPYPPEVTEDGNYCCLEGDYLARGEAVTKFRKEDTPAPEYVITYRDKYKDGKLSCCGGELKNDGTICEDFPFEKVEDGCDEYNNMNDPDYCELEHVWIIEGEFVPSSLSATETTGLMVHDPNPDPVSKKLGGDDVEKGCGLYPSNPNNLCDKFPFNANYNADGMCVRESVYPYDVVCSSEPEICRRGSYTYYDGLDRCQPGDLCDTNPKDGFQATTLRVVLESGVKKCKVPPPPP